ncbi:MAG: hypothetical protein U1C55_08250 [Smithellaceae bacterium]|nr:hypothetical protein [Smithellaceae bacterium]
MKEKFLLSILLALTVTLAAGKTGEAGSLKRYRIDADTQGVIEKVNNIYNTSIVSNDPNVFKAEYEAGFIQGKLQRKQILAARDNIWDMAFQTNPSHSYPKQIPPSKDELLLAQKTLKFNWDYTLDYIRRQGNTDVAKNLRRLIYRLVGIYHGTAKDKPQALAFDNRWLPMFTDAEMRAGYETPLLTFIDLYFINAFGDLLDVLPDNAPAVALNKSSKCSAFVKRTSDDILLTHNSWYGFLDQSQVLSLWVNGDFMTVNILAPGFLGSGTDFGYNNKGIIFNETTHRAMYTEPKADALWMFWRAVLAEQFAASLDDFFNYISLEASGTYMNGYMVVDAKTKEIGYVEMSFKSFVFFKPDGKGGVAVTTKPEGLNKAYNKELVQPDYVLGINYPASQQIIDDLKAQDNRPARKRQFLSQIGGVKDIESAKALITYTDPKNPLSIFGRWDLGYGETPAPKTIPDGSVDAKAISLSMVKEVFNLKGVLDTGATGRAFWMKFGTPYVEGKPFIWSESPWKGTKLRDVPDRLDGEWTLINLYMR